MKLKRLIVLVLVSLVLIGMGVFSARQTAKAVEIQKAMFPFVGTVNVNQVSWGFINNGYSSGAPLSHLWQNAYCLDLVASNGYLTAYAPYDGYYYQGGSGNTMAFASKDKVWLRGETEPCYVYMVFAHNEDAYYWNNGTVIKQGTPIYRQGAEGIGSGSHIDFNVAKGVFNPNYFWSKNTDSANFITTTWDGIEVYCSRNSINPFEKLYFDPTVAMGKNDAVFNSVKMNSAFANAKVSDSSWIHMWTTLSATDITNTNVKLTSSMPLTKTQFPEFGCLLVPASDMTKEALQVTPHDTTNTSVWKVRDKANAESELLVQKTIYYTAQGANSGTPGNIQGFGKVLESGTKYYYKFFAKLPTTETYVYSDVGEFITSGTGNQIQTLWYDYTPATYIATKPQISVTNPELRAWVKYDPARTLSQGGLIFGSNQTAVSNATYQSYSGAWLVKDTSGIANQSTDPSSKKSNFYYDITSQPTNGFGQAALTPGTYYFKFFSVLDNGEVRYSTQDNGGALFTYSIPVYVTLVSGTGGSITTGASGSYNPGSTINLTAAANSTHQFNHWESSNGGTFGNASLASTTFTVPNNATTITAVFSIIPDYSLSVSPNTVNFGTLYAGYAAQTGQQVTITNNGNQVITLNTTANPANFTFENYSKSTLVPSESSTVTVKPRLGLGKGVYNIQVYVGSGMQLGSAPLQLNLSVIDPSPVAPRITTTSLNNGTVGVSYSEQLAATGDTPITWSIDTGSLPAGLSLSAAGVISGTPAAAGTATFTVKASNGVNPDATKQLSIQVGVLPQISISPSATIVKDKAGIVEISIGSNISGFSSNNFLYLQMDGNAVAQGMNTFTVRNGSIIIQMNPSYLNTLSIGDHRVTIGLQGAGYENSTVATTITVVERTPTTPPKTGDDNPILVLTLLSLLSVCGIGIFATVKRKRARS